MIPIICHILAWEKRHSWERHNSVSMQDAGDLFLTFMLWQLAKWQLFLTWAEKQPIAHHVHLRFILHSPLAHNLMYFLFSNINLLVISIYSFYVYFFSIFYYVFWMHYCIIADNIVTLMWQQIWYQTYWFVFLSYRVSMFHGKDIDNVSIGWVLTFLTLWLKTYDLINILWECGTMCMRSILTVFTKIFPASHLSQSGEELLRCFLVQAMYFNRG